LGRLELIGRKLAFFLVVFLRNEMLLLDTNYGINTWNIAGELAFEV
jgi:hypothetical protein